MALSLPGELECGVVLTWSKKLLKWSFIKNCIDGRKIFFYKSFYCSRSRSYSEYLLIPTLKVVNLKVSNKENKGENFIPFIKHTALLQENGIYKTNVHHNTIIFKRIYSFKNEFFKMVFNDWQAQDKIEKIRLQYECYVLCLVSDHFFLIFQSRLPLLCMMEMMIFCLIVLYHKLKF